MAAKKGHEIATIDVELVTITIGGDNPKELGLKTSNQIQADTQIETTDAIKLIIKGVLIAQKRQIDVITGNSLTLSDNVFNPELVQMVQGGKIEYDDDGNFKKYTPPVVGEEYKPIPFTLRAYSAHYDASGLIIDYEKTTFPNCTGVPVAFSSQDGVFRTPQYTILSAPAEGEAPYDIEMVKELPVLENADWLETVNALFNTGDESTAQITRSMKDKDVI